MTTKINYKKIDINKVVNLARDAGILIMKFYNLGNFQIQRKQDNSPVTEADLASSNLIIERLKLITPNIKVVSEEEPYEVNDNIIKNDKFFWLIDPIDGTWSFIKRKGKFTVNIALIKDGKPIFGVIYSPLDEINYYSDFNKKAFKIENQNITQIISNKEFTNGYNFLVSNQNLDQLSQDLINNFNIKTITPMPSSIKFALMAEGKGDIYPRFKPTFIWDTAAGHAILNAVGGEIYATDISPLVYNIRLENPNFIAVSTTDINLNK